MTDPIEVELKLEFDPSDRDRIVAAIPVDQSAARTVHLVTTYFDTPRRAVRRAGYSVRIRRQGSLRTQTVKADGAAAAGLFVRPEWEREVDSDIPAIDARDGPLAGLVGRATLRRLAPLFVTDVRRTEQTIDSERGRIRCAIDECEIRAGSNALRFCELELELEAGPPQLLFDTARGLNETVPLRLAVSSKAQRGYALLAGSSPDAVKAEPIDFDRRHEVGDAFEVIARSCLRQFRLNEALLDRDGVEPIHQARVALRRLRTAFAAHHRLFAGDPRANLLEAELHWLAVELGEVRNLDVLIASGLRPAPRAHLVLVRERALAHVRGELASARTRLLMIDLAEWLAVGDWRTRPADPELLHRDVASFAADLLERQRRRLARRGENLADLDDRRRHRARIAAKTLRYAVEFFASLYDAPKESRRRERFVGALEALQDDLGALNDLVVGPQILARLGIDAQLPHAGKRRRARLARHAEAAYEMLIHARRFWR